MKRSVRIPVNKINLSIVAFTLTTMARSLMLPSVRAAELKVVEAAGARPCLPMEGAANFRTAVQHLCLVLNTQKQ